MSFLKDIVNFPSDSSSDEEEFVAPKRSLNRNPSIREKPCTIHRLSNLDETLRNMPYNQNYNNMMHNGNSTQSSNSSQSVHRVRFNDTSTDDNNSNSIKNKIGELEDKINRLQKIIKIKTKENRDMKSKNKTFIDKNKCLLKDNQKIKEDYQVLESKIKELNITHENMNSFIQELKDLIQNHIGVFMKNNQYSKDNNNRKRKRSITSSDISSDENIDEIDDYNNVNENENENKYEDKAYFDDNDKALNDINSSIDLENIVSTKRKRIIPTRFQHQTFKNF